MVIEKYGWPRDHPGSDNCFEALTDIPKWKGAALYIRPEEVT